MMQLRSQGFSSLVFFISILTGCGGGGGGGGGSNATTGGGSGAPVGGGGSSSSLLDNISGKTEAQFIQIADQLAENVYSGATTQSSVSAVSIQPLVRLLLLGEGELVGDITGALAKTADPSAEATGLPSLVAARKIDVNDSQSCENSDGSILLSGSVNDQGIGAVNLSFNNCILGGVTADGDGAVYLQDASGIDFMFAWDSVSFTLGGITETASGLMLFESEQTTIDMVINSSSPNEQIRVSNWTYSFDVFQSGTLYHPDYGNVFVELYSEEPRSFALRGASSSKGFLIDDGDYWIYLLDDDGDDELDGIGFSSPADLLSADQPNSELSSLNEVEFPAGYEERFANLSRDELSLNLIDSSGDPITIDVTENHFPQFTSASSADTSENKLSTGYFARANDPDGDQLSYQLSGGTDQSLFIIDESTGELRFRLAPDFEQPTDTGADNTYEVTIEVSEERGGRDSLALQVGVVDVDSNSIPEFSVGYPTPNANLGGFAFETTVRGRISVTDGISANMLSVNGEVATFDILDPYSWSVQIPVAYGQNNLDVQMAATDASMQVDSQLLQNSRAIRSAVVELDPANNRVFLVGSWAENGANSGGLYSANLLTGSVEQISGPNIGNGPDMFDPSAVELDSVNNRVLVLDQHLDAMFSIDLSTGDREMISGRELGTGNFFREPTGIQYDSLNDRALVTDIEHTALIAVDMATGNRTEASGTDPITGDDLRYPTDLVLDTVNSRVLVTHFQSLISIDLASGDLATISSSDRGTGSNFVEPWSLELDSANNRVLISDVGLDAILSVDLATGNRTLISDDEVGTGVTIGSPESMALDLAGNRLIVSDDRNDRLIDVNLDDGNRSIISEVGGAGDGPNFSYPLDLAFDDLNDRLLVIDDGTDALVAVDIFTGNRTVLSSESLGGGPEMTISQGVVFDRENNRALITDRILNAVLAVDLSNGDRAIISNGSVSLAEGIPDIRGIVLDEQGDRVIVVDYLMNALISVDLNSGQRSVLTEGLIGSDSDFSRPINLFLDSSNSRLLVVTESQAHLTGVDLNTGDRRILSSANIGSGIGFDYGTDVAIDEENNKALVLAGDLVSIDFVSGDRTLVSGGPLSDSRGSGPSLTLTKGSMFVDGENNRAFILHDANRSIILVDLPTGERAYFSK